MARELEIGDIVTVEKAADSDSAPYEFMAGILDMIWTKDGAPCYTVLFDGDHFAYASKVSFVKKG